MNKIKSLLSFLRQKELIPIPELVNEKNLLEGRCALISGGTGGIGQSIAEKYVKHGCKVVLAGTNENKLGDVCDRINKITPHSANVIKIDISDVPTLSDKIAIANTMFPDYKLDILVNAAGVNLFHGFLDTTESDFDKVIDVNLKGCFFLSQAFALFLIHDNRKGNILNLSSASALRPGSTPYIISKWGIDSLTRGAADVLLPYGIIVNAIAPGSVATPMLKKDNSDSIENDYNILGRYALPSEVAEIAVMMVSKVGQLIIGDTIYMTGGSGVLDLHK